MIRPAFVQIESYTPHTHLYSFFSLSGDKDVSAVLLYIDRVVYDAKEQVENKIKMGICYLMLLFKSPVKSQGSTLGRQWKLPSWSTVRVGAEGISAAHPGP